MKPALWFLPETPPENLWATPLFAGLHGAMGLRHGLPNWLCWRKNEVKESHRVCVRLLATPTTLRPASFHHTQWLFAHWRERRENDAILL